MHDDAFLFGLFDLFQRRRHFFAAFQADDVHFARAHAQRGERDVHHFLGGNRGDVFVGRLEIFHAAGMLLDDFARCRASHVHGDVAAADHDHFLADGELVAEIHVEQEIDALVHAVEIDAGNGQVAAAVRAHGDQHRIESLPPQIGDREVASGGLIQLERDVAGFENLAHLRFHHVARQSIFGNAQIQHSARDRRRFENRDRIAHQREIVRRRESHRAAADDRNFERQFLLPASCVHVDGMLRLRARSCSVRKRFSARIEMGLSISPRRHAVSQGCAQTRPQMLASGFGSRANR